MNNELYIHTNGVLISRRLITHENGTALTPVEVQSVTLNVYKLTMGTGGLYERKLLSTANLTPSDVVTATVETDSNGVQYNFNYCVENAFTLTNTLYLVEYIITDGAGHRVIITAKGRTQD